MLTLIPKHACTLSDDFNMPQMIKYTNLNALTLDTLYIVETDGKRSRTTKRWMGDVFKYCI